MKQTDHDESGATPRRKFDEKFSHLDSAKQLLALRAAPVFDFTVGRFERRAVDFIQFLKTAETAKQ